MRKLILLLICSLVCSCSITPEGIPPDVSLVDVQFSDVTLFETSADFVIRIQNPNPFPLELDGASHTIILNGINIGKGLSDEATVVPRLGSAKQKVKVHLNNLSLVRNMQDLMDAKSFNYKIESVLYLSGAFSSSYSVTQAGRFNRE